MKAKEQQLQTEALLHSIDFFFSTGDTSPFLQNIHQETEKIINRVSSHDADFNRDYFLHHIMHLDECLLKYRNYSHIPFIKFYASYIKNDLRNFVKIRNRRKLKEHLVAEIPPVSYFPDNSSAFIMYEDLPGLYLEAVRTPFVLESEYTRKFYTLLHSLEPENFCRYAVILDSLELLPVKKSICYKLSKGLPLSIAEMSFLVQSAGDTARFTAFIDLYEKKKKTEEQFAEEISESIQAVSSTILRLGSTARRKKLRSQYLKKINERRRSIVNINTLTEFLELKSGTISRMNQKTEKEIVSLSRRRFQKLCDSAAMADTSDYSSSGILAGSCSCECTDEGISDVLTAEFRIYNSAFILILDWALKKNTGTIISLYRDSGVVKYFKVLHRTCLPLDGLSPGRYSLWGGNKKLLNFSIKE